METYSGSASAPGEEMETGSDSAPGEEMEIDQECDRAFADQNKPAANKGQLTCPCGNGSPQSLQDGWHEFIPCRHLALEIGGSGTEYEWRRIWCIACSRRNLPGPQIAGPCRATGCQCTCHNSGLFNAEGCNEDSCHHEIEWVDTQHNWHKRWKLHDKNRNKWYNKVIYVGNGFRHHHHLWPTKGKTAHGALWSDGNRDWAKHTKKCLNISPQARKQAAKERLAPAAATVPPVTIHTQFSCDPRSHWHDLLSEVTDLLKIDGLPEGLVCEISNQDGVTLIRGRPVTEGVFPLTFIVKTQGGQLAEWPQCASLHVVVPRAEAILVPRAEAIPYNHFPDRSQRSNRTVAESQIQHVAHMQAEGQQQSYRWAEPEFHHGLEVHSHPNLGIFKVGPCSINGTTQVKLPGLRLPLVHTIIISNSISNVFFNSDPDELHRSDFQVRPLDLDESDKAAIQMYAAESAYELIFTAPGREAYANHLKARGEFEFEETIEVSWECQTIEGAVPKQKKIAWRLGYVNTDAEIERSKQSSLIEIETLKQQLKDFADFAAVGSGRKKQRQSSDTAGQPGASGLAMQLDQLSIEQNVVFDSGALDSFHFVFELAMEISDKRPHFAMAWAQSAHAVIQTLCSIDNTSIRCDQARLKQLKAEADKVLPQLEQTLNSADVVLVATDTVRTAWELYSTWRGRCPAQDKWPAQTQKQYAKFRDALYDGAALAMTAHVTDVTHEDSCAPEKTRVLRFVRELHPMLESPDSAIRQHTIDATSRLPFCCLDELKTCFDEMLENDISLEVKDAANTMLECAATTMRFIEGAFKHSDLALEEEAGKSKARTYALQNAPMHLLHLLQSQQDNKEAAEGLTALFTDFQYVQARCEVQPGEVLQLLAECNAASKFKLVQEDQRFCQYHEWLQKDAAQIANMPSSEAILTLAHDLPDSMAPAQHAKSKLARGDSWCGRIMGKSDELSVSDHYPFRFRVHQHQSEIVAVAWSADGQTVASGSADGKVGLWHAVTGEKLDIVTCSSNCVSSVAWNQDHRLVAGFDKFVRIWDASTSNLVEAPALPETHETPVVATVWANHSSRLASVSNSKVQIWHCETIDGVASCTKWESYASHALEGSLTSVAWNHDNSRLAVGSARGICLWDPATDTEHVLDAQDMFAHTLRCKRVALILSLRQLTINPKVLLENMTLSLAMAALHPQKVTCLSWSPNGILLAAGSEYGHVRLWRHDVAATKSWEPSEPTHCSGSSVRSVAWAADSRKLAFSYDCCVHVCTYNNDACTLDHLAKFEGHTGPVSSVAWNHQGDKVVSGSHDCSMKIWEPSQAKPAAQGHTNGVFAVAVSPDCRFVASASYDGSAKVWDADAGTCISEYAGDGVPLFSVAWHPCNEWLVVGAQDGCVRIYNIDKDRAFCLRSQQSTHSTAVVALAWSSDGSKIVSGAKAPNGQEDAAKAELDQAGGAFVWNVSTCSSWLEDIMEQSKEQLLTILPGVPLGVCAIAWSPGGQMFLTATRQKQIKLWDTDMALGETTCLDLKAELEGLNCVAWSPDGARLALGCDEKSIQIYSIAEKRIEKELKGHQRPVQSLAWSPCGYMLASGSGASGNQSENDNTIRIWNVEGDQDREEIKVLRTHTQRVNSIAWSSDSKRIVSGSRDHTVRVWDVPQKLWRVERELKTTGCVAEQQSLKEREERAARGEGTVIGENASGELLDERTPTEGICDEVNAKLQEQGFEPTCTIERVEAWYTKFSIDCNNPMSRRESQLDRAWSQVDRLVSELSILQSQHETTSSNDGSGCSTHME